MTHFGFQITEYEPDRLAKQILLAAKEGFDSAWFPDHIVSLQSPSSRVDAWTVLAFLAGRSEKIRLGCGVSDTYRRHPSTLAHMAATLDFLSGGRAILGIGAGEAVNLASYGIKMIEPVQRLRESIIAIRKLYASSFDQPFDYKGKCFSFHEAFLEVPKVRKNGPPIYVGAQGKRTRMLAGELGDGWYPWLHTLDSYRTFVREVDEGIELGERNADEVDKVARLYTYITDDTERGLQVVGKTLRKSLVLERSVLREMGFIHSMIPPLSHTSFVANRQNFDLLEKEASKVPIEAVAKVATVGNSDFAIETTEKYIKFGSTNVVVRPHNTDDLLAFARKVVPYFQAKD